ncbi:MAG TPA: chemotaxis protein CheW [Polyangiaceae bacterium]|nr:chemotaxis protein CheW [Polyangiaceae bacterium]
MSDVSKRGQGQRHAARRGGVLVRVDGALSFVPASIALRIAPPPRVTPVPAAPPELLGIASYEGSIVPVIVIGPARREMILCQHAGEIVGLVGGEVVRTGTFDAVPGRVDLVEHEGERAHVIDLPGIYGRVQASARPLLPS